MLSPRAFSLPVLALSAALESRAVRGIQAGALSRPAAQPAAQATRAAAWRWASSIGLTASAVAGAANR